MFIIVKIYNKYQIQWDFWYYICIILKPLIESQQYYSEIYALKVSYKQNNINKFKLFYRFYNLKYNCEEINIP